MSTTPDPLRHASQEVLPPPPPPPPPPAQSCPAPVHKERLPQPLLTNGTSLSTGTSLVRSAPGSPWMPSPTSISSAPNLQGGSPVGSSRVWRMRGMQLLSAVLAGGRPLASVPSAAADRTPSVAPACWAKLLGDGAQSIVVGSWLPGTGAAQSSGWSVHVLLVACRSLHVWPIWEPRSGLSPPLAEHKHGSQA